MDSDEIWKQKYLEHINDRFDRLETKVDLLMDHRATVRSEAKSRATWTAGIISAVVAVLATLVERLYR